MLDTSQEKLLYNINSSNSQNNIYNNENNDNDRNDCVYGFFHTLLPRFTIKKPINYNENICRKYKLNSPNSFSLNSEIINTCCHKDDDTHLCNNKIYHSSSNPTNPNHPRKIPNFNPNKHPNNKQPDQNPQNTHNGQNYNFQHNNHPHNHSNTHTISNSKNPINYKNHLPIISHLIPILFTIICIATVFDCVVGTENKVYINEWVIEVDGGEMAARKIARQHNLVYVEKVGN